MNEKSKRILIFTDLDGTLLDSQDYSFDAALPALEKVRQRKIPLVLCSSKTRAEMEFYQGELNIDEPFVSENGGALFAPWGYFDRIPKGSEKIGRHLVLEFGIPYQKIRKSFSEVAARLDVKPIGFGDLEAEEVSSLLNLSIAEAELAREREYDEAFYFPETPNQEQLRLIEKQFNQHGLRLTTGGKLFHLHGDHDKGEAVRSLIRMYMKNSTDEFLTIGLGDSMNDLSLLEAVDLPVLLKKEDGSYQEGMPVELKVQKTSQAGPRGWNQAVLELLERLGDDAR
jgi:mannosyl-3-phosphoglycerate phosphatase